MPGRAGSLVVLRPVTLPSNALGIPGRPGISETPAADVFPPLHSLPLRTSRRPFLQFALHQSKPQAESLSLAHFSATIALSLHA